VLVDSILDRFCWFVVLFVLRKLSHISLSLLTKNKNKKNAVSFFKK